MVSSAYLVIMNAQINQLVKSLLQKDSIEQCSVQELQQYAERHPYFGAAQLLLTKKLQTENAGNYNEQLQKTLLFFHNPMWVEQLLNDNIGTALITKAGVLAVEEAGTAPVAEIITAQTPAKTEEAAFPSIAAEEPVIENPAFHIKAAEDAKSDLLFEPYHTVDYFASQGIKFKEEEKPKDKFGQQLKSFTEWLKAMKKLPVAETAVALDNKSEQKVEQLAENSLQERDVVTETMADVWEKQGNIQKAIEIYSKLSLLEPAKSTYFAAKIEELKKKN